MAALRFRFGLKSSLCSSLARDTPSCFLGPKGSVKHVVAGICLRVAESLLLDQQLGESLANSKILVIETFPRLALPQENYCIVTEAVTNIKFLCLAYLQTKNLRTGYVRS